MYSFLFSVSQYYALGSAGFIDRGCRSGAVGLAWKARLD